MSLVINSLDMVLFWFQNANKVGSPEAHLRADCGTLTNPFKHDIRSSIVSVQNLEDSNMKTVVFLFMKLIRDSEESLSRPCGGVRGRGNRLYLACFSSLRAC